MADISQHGSLDFEFTVTVNVGVIGRVIARVTRRGRFRVSWWGSVGFSRLVSMRVIVGLSEKDRVTRTVKFGVTGEHLVS